MANGDGSALLDDLVQPSNQLIDYVRGWIRDEATKNKIPRNDQEHEAEDIEQALQLTLDDWNSTPPVDDRDFDNYPSLSLLVKGTTLVLLEGSGIFHARNELSYSDGGIQVRIHNKTSLYAQWINTLASEYFRKVQRLKVADNMKRAFGTLESPAARLGM